MGKKIIAIILSFIGIGIVFLMIFLNTNQKVFHTKGNGAISTIWGVIDIEGEKRGEHMTLILSGSLGKATLDITNNKKEWRVVLSGFEENKSIYDYKSQQIQKLINNNINKDIMINNILAKGQQQFTRSRYGNRVYLSGVIKTDPLLGKHSIEYRAWLQNYCIPYLRINGLHRYCFSYGHIDISVDTIILKRTNIYGKLQQL